MKDPRLKVGANVKFTRRNGKRAAGRVAGSDQLYNGLWVAVNTAPKGQNPVITKVRISELALSA